MKRRGAGLDAAPKPEELTPNEVKLMDAFDKAFARAKSLINRQDDIVRGLGQVQKFLDGGFPEAAVSSLKALMARDLKQAAERVANVDAALRLAAATLQRHDKQKDVAAAVASMKFLVPEAFEEAPKAPAGAS